MTLLQRRVLLGISILLFLALAPLIILYSLGYSFDFAKSKIVPTGGIYVKAFPKGVKVYLDNALVKENSSYSVGTGILIKDLPENDYEIRIEKEGYYSWHKEVPVKSGFVTEFKYVLLPEKNPEGALSTLKSITEIRYPEAKVKTLEKILGLKIPQFEFDSTANTTYFISKNKLYSFDGTANQSSLLAEHVVAFKHYPGILYYLTDDGTFFAIQNKETKKIAQLIPRGTEGGTLHVFTNAEIQASSRDLVAILSEGTLSLLNGATGEFSGVDDNVTSFSFSTNGEKILYARSNRLPGLALNEIWVYFLEPRVQPLISSGDKEIIYSTTAAIDSATWFGPDEEQVIFTKIGEGIYVSEIDSRGGQNNINWIKAPNAKIYYDRAGQSLYYEDGSKVFRIALDF